MFKISYARAEAHRLAEEVAARAAQARVNLLLKELTRSVSLSQDVIVKECTEELQRQRDERIRALLRGFTKIGRLE